MQARVVEVLTMTGYSVAEIVYKSEHSRATTAIGKEVGRAGGEVGVNKLRMTWRSTK
jgi:hypothetical protein